LDLHIGFGLERWRIVTFQKLEDAQPHSKKSIFAAAWLKTAPSSDHQDWLQGDHLRIGLTGAQQVLASARLGGLLAPWRCRCADAEPMTLLSRSPETSWSTANERDGTAFKSAAEIRRPKLLDRNTVRDVTPNRGALPSQWSSCLRHLVKAEVYTRGLE
jgi:hypothetical protein